MKWNVKQRIKSIVALGMAMMMALIPVNGSVPGVFGAEGDRTFTIKFVDEDGNEVPGGSISKVSFEDGTVMTPENGVYTVAADMNESAVIQFELLFPVGKELSEGNNLPLEAGDTEGKGIYEIKVEEIFPDSGLEAEITIKLTDASGNEENVPVAEEPFEITATRAEQASPDRSKFSGMAEYYNGNSATITYNEAGLATGCKVEYVITSSVNEPTDGAVWSEAAGTDGTYSFTVNKNADAQYIHLRYEYADATKSGSVCSDAIKFDDTSPTVNSVTFAIEGAACATVQDYWVNDSTKIEIWIGAADTGSGLNELTYEQNGTSVSINDENGVYKVPFERTKGTLSYTIKDKAGNSTTDSVANLPTNIKVDTEAPEISGVTYQISTNGTDYADATEEDLNDWQTFKVIAIITVNNVASTKPGEGTSGISEVVIENERNNEIISVDEPENNAPSTYKVEITTDGIHDLSIRAKDQAGNESSAEEGVIKIDITGIKDERISLNTTELTDANAFFDRFEIYAQATSASGIKKVTYDFYNLSNELVLQRTAEEGDITGNENTYTARCSFPLDDSLEEFNGYVVATFIDNAAVETSTIVGTPHAKKAEKKNFAFNKNGARISLFANTEWSNQAASVQVNVTDSTTKIKTIQYYINSEDNLVRTVNDVNASAFSENFALTDNSPSWTGTELIVKVICDSGAVTQRSIFVRIDNQAPSISFGGITEGGIYNTNRTLQITTVENIWQEMRPVSVTATRTIDGNTTDIDLGAYEAADANSVVGRTFTEDGIYRVTVSAVDAAGNSDTKTISFTIDKTAPVLSMTGTSEGTYNNRPVTINFQSVETFFETNNVRINVERKLGGSTYGRTVSFTNTGRISNLSNTFSEDGDYTITMTATDGAGNVAALQTLTFTVDCTAPVVTLSGTRDYFVTSRSVAINFSVVESYYQTNEVQIQGNRKLANGRTEAIRITGWNNSGITSTLNQEFTEDGYYTLTITATDKAGNNKQQTIHFTIDTEPPVIGDLSKYDGKYLSQFQLNERLEDLISELSVPTVKMTLNGEAYDGSEITKDGKYTLVIEVVDEVGLSSTKSIEFVIDRTAPKIIFAGVENNRTYTEAVNLNLTLENENDTIVAILVNGVPYELIQGAASYDLTFDTYGKYEIVVNTIDEAGNENSQTIAFTYAEHRNAVFLWILIGAVIVAAGLVAVLVIKSRKK